jgi:hypothetical protein
MCTLKGWINRGRKEEGYIEKATNADLDSKTDNKGSGNYTKYARDISACGLMGSGPALVLYVSVLARGTGVRP